MATDTRAPLSGIGVSRGYSIGTATHLRRDLPEIVNVTIDTTAIDAEIHRLESALERTRVDLTSIAERLPPSASLEARAIIDTHLLMLNDSSMTIAPKQLIRERSCNAEWALKLQRDKLVAIFDAMQDPYLRARRHDIVQVISRIQRRLLDDGAEADFSQRLKQRIIVADDLSPADTIVLKHQGVLGFITEVGGPLSHTAILARSLEIPAVVGVRQARHLIQEGQALIIDGDEGLIHIEPGRSTLARFRLNQRGDRRRRRALTALKDKPAMTLDRQRIELFTNVDLPEDTHAAQRVGSDGVGLFRTEFLFLNRGDLPTEEEQFCAYREVIEAFEGLPVNVRTLDLGADKQLLAGEFDTAVDELDTHSAPNPALGLRAIRLCLQNEALFVPQLRAILRASAFGKVRIMLPMLSSPSELRQCRALIERTKQSLGTEGHAFDRHIEIGGMIEVPAAAIIAPYFARRLDFLSIGTNDLIQYALAIDRTDDAVNYLYDTWHPAVITLIHQVLEAGRATQTPVSLCGEMAGARRYTRLLLGLGLTQFSTHPNHLLEVKQLITESSASDAHHLVEQLMATDSEERYSELVALLACP